MWRAIILFVSFFFLFLSSAFLSTSPVLADGLVPCGGPGEEPCQACHVVALTSNIFNWFGVILAIIFVIVIVVAGLYIVSSNGAVEAKVTARRIITNLIVGYIIFLAVWFVVDFFLKIIASDQTYGMWNEIQCVAQPELQEWSRVPASQYDPVTGQSTPLNDYSSGEVATAVTAINSNGSVASMAQAAAANVGLTSEQTKTFRALINQESSNCVNKVGPSTSYGTAYGCTQMLVSTARQMDKDLRDLTNAQIAEKLTNDNAYSIGIGAKYFKSLLDKYNGDTDKALAAYNGGPGANAPSKDCPGQARWQCVWDSPGCYETGKTDCKKNEGFNSYEQTRHYVSNINKVAASL